jgi:exoribonuclease R
VSDVFAHKLRTPKATIDFAAIRDALDIPRDYPPDAVAEAESAATSVLAQALSDPSRADERSIPLVTIDPAGSTDLDQAVHLERTGDGFRVHYAIADVAAFVAAGGALDAESRHRGMTLYSPDTRTPLYPTVLSEGAASLLPDQDRPAVLWTIDLDTTGEPVSVDLHRALVRSRAQLDYAGVQSDADAGRLHPSIALLPAIGALRQQAARRRHAINLDLPDSEVVPDGHGHWTLERRAVLPVEKDNAEISLLTGMCAATIMLKGTIGILRTLPPPTHGQVEALRRATKVLGIPWPHNEPAGDVVSALDSSKPREAAFLEDAVRLLRGAGYTPFDGALPAETGHGGVGAPYAHVTAPLRRLVDRFGTEVCLALHAERPVPDWARSGLPDLPAAMSAADHVSDELDRACATAVSEFLLADRVGEQFDGIVVQIDRDRHRATILLDDPPVRARCDPDHLTEGSRITVQLTELDTTDHAIVVKPVN